MSNRGLIILFFICLGIDSYSQGNNAFKSIEAAERFFVQKLSFTAKAIDSCHRGYTLTKFDINPDGTVNKVETLFGEHNELNNAVNNIVRKSDKMWSKIYSEKVKTVLLPVFFINSNALCRGKARNTGNSDKENFFKYKHVLNNRFSLQNCLFLQGINVEGGNRIE